MCFPESRDLKMKAKVSNGNKGIVKIYLINYSFYFNEIFRENIFVCQTKNKFLQKLK